MRVKVLRSNKKQISLHLDESGVLQVVAYKKIPFEKVKEFVESKRDWVERQLEKQQRQQNACETAGASNGTETVDSVSAMEMFAGKSCMIGGVILPVRPTVESKSYMDGVAVYLPEKLCAAKEVRLKALKSFVKKTSVQNAAEEVSRFGSFVSLCPTKIDFKNLAVGWVKCTKPSERIVSLDYRICQLPERLQKYLIVHAFAHFKHDGHGAAFWNTLSNYLPDFSACVDELKNYEFLKEI